MVMVPAFPALAAASMLVLEMAAPLVMIRVPTSAVIDPASEGDKNPGLTGRGWLGKSSALIVPPFSNESLSARMRIVPPVGTPSIDRVVAVIAAFRPFTVNVSADRSRSEEHTSEL